METVISSKTLVVTDETVSERKRRYFKIRLYVKVKSRYLFALLLHIYFCCPTASPSPCATCHAYSVI